MAAVLEITPDERPVLSYVLARLIPMLMRDTPEDQETGRHLAFTLRGLDDAPAGPVEAELVTQDLYALGIHIASIAIDLEEYWLDLREQAAGRPPVEVVDEEVVAAAARYLPQVATDPTGWDYKQVEEAFIDLGFKIDRLFTAEAPRARAMYNKSRNPILNKALLRRRTYAELRFDQLQAGRRLEPAGTTALEREQLDEHGEPLRRPRPAGTALAPARTAPAGLSVTSRATFPLQYDWGVDIETGVNADDLEPGEPKRVNIGGAELMLVNTGDRVCAAAGICTHRGWDLSRGPVVDGIVTCSLHGAQYDVRTGEVVRQPFDPDFNREHSMMGGMGKLMDPKHTAAPLETYPTTVADDGEVHVHI